MNQKIVAASPVDYVSPTPEQIRQKRKSLRLTQAQAAAFVCSDTKRWQDWELGVHRMHPGLWRLFLIETLGKPY